MTEKLTQTLVERLKKTGKQYYVRSSDRTGFAVRVSPAGRKTYTLRYRHPGAKGEKDHDIALTSEMSCDAAMRKAREMRVEFDKAKEKAQAVKRVSEAIESSFHLLGLSEIQEAFFIKLIEKELDECDENQDISAIDDTLQGVLACLAPQVDEVGISHQDASSNEASEDPPMYQDVEFF